MRNRSRAPRGRRLLAGLVIAAAGVVALLIIAAFGAVALSLTPWGNERLRVFALEQVNQSISGELTARQLRFRGDHLVLQGAVLKDPDGNEVGSVERLELSLRLSSLLARTIDVRAVQLFRPELFVVERGGETNLQRALAPRHPRPEKDEQRRGGPNLALGRLTVRDGVLSLEQHRPEGVERYRIDDLRLDGTGRLVDGGELLAGRVELDGRLVAPVEGPLRVEVQVAGSREQQRVSAEVSGPGLRLSARAALSRGSTDLLVHRLEAAPSVVRVFDPDWPLIAPVAVDGVFHQRGERLSAKLDAAAAEARAHLDFAGNLAAFELSRLRLSVENVDLSQLVRDGPKSDASFDLRAQGSGRTPQSAKGSLVLTAPPSSMGEVHVFGPVELRASVEGGVATVEELDATLPGVRLQGSGSISRERVDLEAELLARDLRGFSETLGTLAGPSGLDVGGSGTAKLRATGPTRNPSLALDAAFPVLRIGDRRFFDLRAKASLPEARRPLTLDARVTASRLERGEGDLNDLQVELTTVDRALTLEASARGRAMLISLTAEGRLDRDRRGLELHRLTLSYPRATWSLEQKTKLRFDDDELSVRGLALVSGSQALRLDGSRRGAALFGTLRVQQLDLAALPSRLFDGSGILDVEAEASGTVRAPEVKGRVALRDGRYETFDELSFAVDGSFSGQRLTGTAWADGLGSRLEAEFDLPLRALRERRREKVHLAARVEELDLERLARAGLRLPLTGRIAGTLAVDGMANDPRLDAQLSGRDLRYEQLPPTAAELRAQSGEDGALSLRLDVRMLDKKGFAELKTGFTVGKLLSRRPTRRELVRAPFSVRADFKEFPLPIPYTADLTNQLVTGVLTVDADLQGPLVKPDGRLKARLAGISRGRSPVLEAGVDAVADAQRIRVELDAIRQDDKAEVLALSAVIDSPPAELATLEVLDAVPVSVDGRLGPVKVSELQSLLEPPRRIGADVGRRNDRPELGGLLSATIEGRGTLGDPRLSLRAQVDGLGADEARPGDVKLSYDYANAAHVLNLSLESRGDGELLLSARADADLSTRGLRKGLDVTAIPLAAKLTANQFDPRFLSGVSRKLRVIGGHIDSAVSLKGTPTQPNVSGRFEWTEGELSVAGTGRYHDVRLLIEGNNQRVEIKELYARAHDGEGRLHLLAEDLGPHFRLKAEIDLDDFPIISLDQHLATVSTRTTLDGTATRSRLDVSRFFISEAHIELPDVRRKDLQLLDRPKDVIFTRRGRPIEQPKRPEKGQAGVGGSGPQRPPAFQLHAKAYGPRNIWIESKDVNAELGLVDGLEVLIDGPPKLFGLVVVHRGRLDVFGRDFEFERNSTVRFTGPPIEPELDVTAVHVNEREEVTVFLAVSGKADALEVKPSSEPPLAETEIFTLLATGRRNLRPGSAGVSSIGGGAASIVGSLAATQLRKTLSNELPLDVLSIEAGDQGLEGTKIEAGTYVNDKLYLGFTGRVGANPNRGENSNAVRMEYQLSRRWSFQAEYGDARSGGADLVWSKEY